MMNNLLSVSATALLLCVCSVSFAQSVNASSLATAAAQSPSTIKFPIPDRLKRIEPIPDGAPSNHLLYSYHRIQYLSCEYTAKYTAQHPAVYPEDNQASASLDLDNDYLTAASKTWVYALMASNAYRAKGQVFKISGWELVGRWESKSSLGLETWMHKGADGNPDEYVVAFEGTESFEDWQTNLSLLYPRQFKEAYGYMQHLQEKVKGVRIVTTGHSLGGAIALNMSLRLPGINYVGFDLSPRGFRKQHKPYYDVDRVLIYEKGEILSLLRSLWFNLKKFNHHRYNFMKFKGALATINNHDMYLIARGLLLTAIKNHDEGARQAFVENLSPKINAQIFEGGKPEDAPHDIEACKCISQNRPQTALP